MNIVLLSGGSGKRLWPISNDIRSKQFIKLFKSNNNCYESMIQHTYHQIKSNNPNAIITITACETQVSIIYNQLGNDVDISIEPCRRDTFPAIVLTMAYLHDVRGMDLDDVVIVCPVDQYVSDDYFKAFECIEKQIAMNAANLVLMGITPYYPSEKYGYILPSSTDMIALVDAFKEKPPKSVANEYILQGALWNSGVFAFKLRYVLDKAHELIDFTDYNDLFFKYETLKKASFDRMIVEKEKFIKVYRFTGNWKDVGTWNALSEVLDENIIGSAITDDSCANVHVINETNIPILCVGLKNIVVVASPDGILVSEKENADAIKQYVDEIYTLDKYVEKTEGYIN